jgi:YD repeat-containing protein
MFRKIYSLGLLGVLLLACVGFAVGFSVSYGLIQSSDATKPSSTIAAPGSDKEQDGLSGPVNRVRTETSKLSFQSGKLVEAPRELLELTVYDRQGRRVDSSYYLVAVNSQAGEEQYQYNDKGNVSEMTLRGAGNEILRKEAYTYEYDALGNWVKMIISTFVYEEGKLSPQPTEVAYRNITYYFDQAIADIVSSSSPTQAGFASGQNAQGSFASLRSAFDGWLAATNARDLEKLLKFYSPRMDAFYRARDVSQDVVRADRTRLFQLAEAIEVKTDAPEITVSGDGRSATMHFNKEYFMRAGGRVRQGKVVQQLRWQLTDEGWRIVSERDIKVLSRG